MTESSVKMTTKSLTVKSSRDTETLELLSVDPSGEVSVTASSLSMGGAGGVTATSLQTNQILGPATGRLEVNGGSEGLYFSANDSLALESSGGTIDILAADDVILSSTNGTVKFNTPSFCALVGKPYLYRSSYLLMWY